MRHVWIASRDRHAEWMRDPKRVPMLRESYYGVGPTLEQAAGVRERIERGLVTLDGLGLRGELAACDPADIAVVDSLTSYVLPHPDGGEPVLVWAAPDLIMRVEPTGPWEVVDYKSGRMREGQAQRDAMHQVTTYAAYLRHGARVLAPEEGCRGRVILLGDGSEIEFDITASDIDAAEVRIHAGAARVAAQRAEADARAGAVVETARRAGQEGPVHAGAVEQARREAYPMTAHRGRCRFCSFAELCQPEQAESATPPVGEAESAA